METTKFDNMSIPKEMYDNIKFERGLWLATSFLKNKKLRKDFAEAMAVEVKAPKRTVDKVLDFLSTVDESYEFSFGEALYALKEGRCVSRAAWGLEFVFKQIPATIPPEVVPKMTSVPESVKEAVEGSSLSYHNQLAFVDKNKFVSQYQPTVEDILAEDWNIL